MTFVKNDNSTASGTIDKIILLFTDSPVDAKRWFELGKVDWADNLVPQEAISTLRRQKRSPLKTTPYLGLTYVIPNVRRPAINLPFRRALNLSVDRIRLVKHVLDGSQLPLARPLPRKLLKSPPGPSFEPALARRILATSQTTRASTVELSFYNGGRNPELAAALQRSWKETLGIEIQLRGMEWKSFLTSTASGDFDLALFTLGGYDAADLLSVFNSESPNNRGSYHSTSVDKNLAAAALAPTLTAHKRLLARVEATLAEDVAVIGLFQLTRHSLVRENIGGWAANTQDHHPWRFLQRN
jgi:oligopeptide transport system substrate-binding protein